MEKQGISGIFAFNKDDSLSLSLSLSLGDKWTLTINIYTKVKECVVST